ncbi:probable serine/threonine-protein kinase kinX [Anopheles albimanus]|uniref:probable serine/threonine-protein kinase kinX n=1 Tax=Anopheles albimanus TaxID=7167 RepID=UPI001642267F|nr:probable serine/threonine-protein kinase kinX [Anopheles albimanus]
MSDATSATAPSEAVKPMVKVTMSDSSTTTDSSSSSSSSNTTETMTMEVSSSSSSSSSSTAEAVRTIETVETATMTDEVEQQPPPQPEQRKESESSAALAAPSSSGSSSSSSTDAGQEPVEAEEEPDTLSPLMTDNHTFLQHQELMREAPSLISSSSNSSNSDRVELQGGGSSSSNSSSPQHCHRRHYHHDEADGEEAHDYGIYDDDEGDEEEEEEDDDELDDEDEMFMRDQEEEPESRNMKHSETKESMSSIDSDVSLSYDRQQSVSDTTSQQQQQQQQQQSEDAANAGSSSDDAAKDSGCEIVAKQTPGGAGNAGDEEGGQEEELEDGESAEEAAFETPDDEMCEKIVEQVEFYFSNENILKDAFLLKHVRRNKEGFVSLKLVSSFKRVRQLTKDWRVVGYAIKRRSAKIEVNDLGTKIRRLEALPEHDETTPSRTVVATGLPYDKYTVEKVSELFSKCGEISLIRVLRPGGPIPADVRQFINKHPELQQNECALVEFTESASARRAQSMTEFVVLELVAPKKKTGKKAANVTKFVESYKFAAGHDIERSRGGEGFDRFRMRRGSGFYPKPDMMVGGGAAIYQPPQYHHHHHVQPLLPMMQPNTIMMESNPAAAPLQQYMPHSPQPRKYSFGAETFECFQQQQQQQQQRRASAYSLGSDASRKFSSCSEGYSSCGEMSRRTSACSSAATDSLSRRTSNCSEAPSRRTSNCSDICSCNARRISQCSSDLMFRRMSQCSSDHTAAPATRKYSVGSNYDRKYANSPELLQQQQQQQQQQGQQGHLLQRRISMDSNGGFDRKYSTGSITGYHTDSPNISPRKYSSGFDPLRKLSSGSDQYYNGRRISTDSGYDRRISIGSECGSAPRSRAGSILCSQHGTPNVPGTGETVVRTPIGPDGSKGFGTRTRRIGVVLPV